MTASLKPYGIRKQRRLMFIFFCRLRRIVIFIGIIFFFSPSCAGSTPVLRLATDPGPLFFRTERRALESGYAFDIGTEGRRIHCKLKADFLPWERVLACMKHGTYDITFPIQSKPEKRGLHGF